MQHQRLFCCIEHSQWRALHCYLQCRLENLNRLTHHSQPASKPTQTPDRREGHLLNTAALLVTSKAAGAAERKRWMAHIGICTNFIHAVQANDKDYESPESDGSTLLTCTGNTSPKQRNICMSEFACQSVKSFNMLCWSERWRSHFFMVYRFMSPDQVLVHRDSCVEVCRQHCCRQSCQSSLLVPRSQVCICEVAYLGSREPEARRWWEAA